MSEKQNLISEDTLDSLFRDAIGAELDEEMLHYQRMAEEEGLCPSEALDQRIHAINKKYKKKLNKQKRRNVLLLAASFLIVLFCTHLVLYNNVEAYRVQFQQIFVRYNTGEGGFGSIDTVDSAEKTDILQVVAPAEDFPFSFWIPEGYQLETISEFDEYQGYCEYENEKNEAIFFAYTLHENNSLGFETNSSIHFDTEDSEINQIFIHGNNGISALRKDLGIITYRIIWSDGNYTLHLSGNFSEKTANYNEILETIANSISYDK